MGTLRIVGIDKGEVHQLCGLLRHTRIFSFGYRDLLLLTEELLQCIRYFVRLDRVDRQSVSHFRDINHHAEHVFRHHKLVLQFGGELARVHQHVADLLGTS